MTFPRALGRVLVFLLVVAMSPLAFVACGLVSGIWIAAHGIRETWRGDYGWMNDYMWLPMVRAYPKWKVL